MGKSQAFEIYKNTLFSNEMNTFDNEGKCNLFIFREDGYDIANIPAIGSYDTLEYVVPIDDTKYLLKTFHGYCVVDLDKLEYEYNSGCDIVAYDNEIAYISKGKIVIKNLFGSKSRGTINENNKRYNS